MIRLFALVLAIALAGCAEPAKKFYVLTPSGPVPAGGGIGLGIGPVNLAEYLNRPNLVLQQAPNQFAVSEDNRWAGDLSSAIVRVTAANLGRLLHTGDVRTYPWQSDDELRYQITLDIRQLHSGQDGYAIIEAGWRAYSLPDRTLKASRTFTASEPLKSDGYDASVAAQSVLLQGLAEDIATHLK